MLKINNLVSGYGSVQILNGANMKVDNQSIVALLGGNGTGKSTILKACSGIIRTLERKYKF
jgi:ABC-type branched-chain amino acid transport systems, ATPase component